MSRDWRLFLDDLIASAEKIARLTAGRDLRSLRADEAAFDAVLFNLQIIGEAVKQFPEDVRSRFPASDQSGPARMRDLIAHRYFALDEGIVWDVCTQHVPRLLGHATRVRAEVDPPAAH